MQVDALLAYQTQAAEVNTEKVGLWHRKLALLRLVP